MRHNFRFLALGFSAVLLASPGLNSTTHAEMILASSNFDKSDEGWTSNHDSANFQWVSSGGNPGGYIQATDQGEGTTWYFVAPAKFLGDVSTARLLTYDVRSIPQSGDTYVAADVILTGGGLTLAYQAAPPYPAASSFSSYSVSLNASAGWKVGDLTGAAATESDMKTVLSGLTDLWIRGEYWFGVGDTGALDNVVLAAAVPEPSSILMAGSGLGLLGFHWLRRRKRNGAEADA